MTGKYIKNWDIDIRKDGQHRASVKKCVFYVFLRRQTSFCVFSLKGLGLYKETPLHSVILRLPSFQNCIICTTVILLTINQKHNKMKAAVTNSYISYIMTNSHVACQNSTVYEVFFCSTTKDVWLC